MQALEWMGSHSNEYIQFWLPNGICICYNGRIIFDRRYAYDIALHEKDDNYVKKSDVKLTTEQRIEMVRLIMGE